MSLKYLGRITGIRGFNGELFVDDVPKKLKTIKPDTVIKIGFSENFCEEYTVRTWRGQKGNVILQLKEITSDNQAKDLKEKAIYSEEKNIKNEENKEFLSDFIGFDVINKDTNELIGKIIEEWEMPANDVWLVQTPKGNLPIPVIDQIIIKRNMESKSIEIFVMPGLMDLLNNTEEEADDIE